MKHQTKEQLFRIITESSFALDEAIQFLDTHPGNQEALDYYHHYQDIYKRHLKNTRNAMDLSIKRCGSGRLLDLGNNTMAMGRRMLVCGNIKRNYSIQLI